MNNAKLRELDILEVLQDPANELTGVAPDTVADKPGDAATTVYEYYEAQLPDETHLVAAIPTADEAVVKQPQAQTLRLAAAFARPRCSPA